MRRTPGLRPITATRRSGLPPALRTDLPVLGALLACSLTVSAPSAHLPAGVALFAAVVVHLRTRRRFARLICRAARRGSTRVVLNRAGAAALVVAVALTGLTGLLRWLGMPPQSGWHGGTGYLLLGLAGLHLLAVRHRLEARLRSVPGARTETVAEKGTSR